MQHYNTAIAGGKWNHMMDQTHIGYTSWQQPEKNIMPQVERLPENRGAFIFREEDAAGAEPCRDISIESAHYYDKAESEKVKWFLYKDLGMGIAGLTTTPVTETPDKDVWAEYRFETTSTGDMEITLRFSPTLNFNGTGLSYSLKVDDEREQTVNINGHYKGELGEWQARRIILSTTKWNLRSRPDDRPGVHILRYHPLSPALVLQNIIVKFGNISNTYMAPPESPYTNG
jgi:hypothetical protein